MKTDNKYLNQLTWFRGLAAFFVIVSHVMRATEVAYTDADNASSFLPLSLLDLGSFGVVLFLVLSGCTLYVSNSESINRKNIWAFYIKRFFRIWPAFAVSLVLYMVFSFVFVEFYANPQGYWVEKQFLYSYDVYDVASYLGLVFNITGPNGIINNAYWSLPVEFQYYLIFPMLIYSVRLVGMSGPILIGLILYFAPRLGVDWFDSQTVFTLAMSFCGGIVAGYLYKRSSGLRLSTPVGSIAMCLLIALASALSNSYIKLPDLPIVSNIWNWYMGISIASVFVLLNMNIRMSRKVESFLEHYGTISYSTYLYHNLFVGMAVIAIIQFKIHNPDLRLLLTFLVVVVPTYMAATLSYKYVEKPSIGLGRALATRAAALRQPG